MRSVIDKSTIIAMDGIFPFKDQGIYSTSLLIVNSTE